MRHTVRLEAAPYQVAHVGVGRVHGAVAFLDARLGVGRRRGAIGSTAEFGRHVRDDTGGVAPRAARLLWLSADLPKVREARHERLVMAASDLEISREVLAAETAGRHAELVAFVTRELAGEHTASLARALTVAGFARPDTTFDLVFHDERFRYGFLGRVAEMARRARDDAVWAERWFHEACRADGAVDLWRYVQLAAASADARCVLWMDEVGGELFEALRPVTAKDLNRSARDRDRSRRDTLFHHTAPPAWVRATRS